MNKIVAITGGIGSGKSTAIKIIEKLGYKSFSADLTYKKLLENERFVKEISSLLGVEPVTLNGKLSIDKNAISRLVFADEEKLKILNAFTHPKIMEEMITSARLCSGIAFCEVPLLFEGGYEDLFDYIFIIKRNDEIRFESASIRDGKTVDQIKNIAKNQFDYAKITQNAHTFIIENDLSEEALAEKIKVAIKDIQK
ncbi:MAG: dephospho-CoA kinase [Clostridia bacterium]|nr:dephospho-CoA kinase [Clostridia bacterium]